MNEAMAVESKPTLSHTPSVQAAFYCVANSAHFVGVVALLNSLRLVGHTEPFYVLDCGLSASQRLTLEPQATIVRSTRSAPPVMLKAVVPLQHPAQVMVLLDADVIILKPLNDLIAKAAKGHVVAFANDDATRYYEEWGSLFGFGSPRRQTYVNFGHVLLPHSFGLELLQELERGQQRVDLRHTWLQLGKLSDPQYFADMDVLNALLASRLPPERIVFLEYKLAPYPPFDGLRLIDEESLVCAYADGSIPYLLHHVQAKPWLKVVRSSVYSRLLTRLVLRDDVPIQLDPSALPLRLRKGGLANLDRLRGDGQALLRRYTRGRLGIRPQVVRWWQRRRSRSSESAAV